MVNDVNRMFEKDKYAGENISEFNRLFDDEFFIIDSDNIMNIKSKLIGFSIVDDEIVRNENFNENISLSKSGCYVYIEATEDKVSFYQDVNGSWGLYVYQLDGYFAISNSFLKLVEYLRNNHKITFNDDFSKAFMSTGLCSVIYKETMINEIKDVPRNFVVHIDKNTLSVEYEKIDFESDSIEINSKEALEIIDNWFYKWVGILRSLKMKTNNIHFNLSGGFDSRVIFLLALCSNIDLNKIYIQSFNDDNYVHREDFTIASEIADFYGFKLNNNPISAKRNYFREFNTTINLAFYVKFGFHKQLDYRFYRTSDPVFNFSGIGGETIRYYDPYYKKTYDEIIDMYLDASKRMHESLVIPFSRIFKKTLINLAKDCNITEEKSEYLFEKHYNEVRSKNHFGKFTAIEYLTNKLCLSPALDLDLHKVKRTTSECDDSYLLIALLFIRFCPKLLEFKFQGGRKIDEKTIDYAKKINDISPFVVKDFDFISGPPLDDSDTNKGIFDGRDVNEYLINVFNQYSFEKKFIKQFPTQLYRDVSRYMAKANYFPLEKAYPAFTSLKLIDDINCYGLDKNYNMSDWIESFIKQDNMDYASISLDNSSNSLLNYDYGDRDHDIIKFDITDCIDDEGEIRINNLNIFNTEGNLIEFNDDEIFLKLNNEFEVSLNNLKKDDKDNSFLLSASNLGVGIHELFLRYNSIISNVKKIYIKYKKNIFSCNVWSGTEYLNNNKGIISGKGQLLETSPDWSCYGKKSLKITKVSDSSLWTDFQTTNIVDGDFIRAYASIYSPNAVCSTFFVFTHNNGKQSFHNGTKIFKNSIQYISLNDVVPKDTKSVALRIVIRGEIGDSVYVDNLSIVKD